MQVRTVTGIVLGTLISATVALEAQPAFGPQLQRKIYPQAAFTPRTVNAEFLQGGYVWEPFNYRRAYTVGLDEDAPLDLPAGAVIEQVCISLYDNATGGACINLEAIELGDVGHLPAEGTPVSGCTPAGTPGYTTFCVVPSQPYTVVNYGDADGDNSPNWISHSLNVATNVASDDLRLGPVMVEYHIGIPTPPVTPTFDDVGSGNEYYKYVEALAARGITEGCSVDNFCPDNPVTRAQLALILARALGLYSGGI